MNSLRLRLPATSANLGPGFDAVGLALSLSLSIHAEVAGEFRVQASGRDAEQVGATENNLVLETYTSLAPHGPALALAVENDIPLGMGCGSSAAARVAGVLLANHFARLGMTNQQVLHEACRLKGHPDNVAACLLGGLTVSAMQKGQVTAASLPAAKLPWRIFIVLPAQGLATEKARALLPESYSRADVVANIQSTALLVSAFALGRADLLQTAMQDRIHQPYREQMCPLLRRVLPVVGERGIYGAALSGAGPSVLLIANETVERQSLSRQIRDAVGGSVELLETSVGEAAQTWFERSANL